MKRSRIPGRARLARVPGPPKKGLKFVGYRLRPEQIAALRREALRRAEASGSGKPDASEIVREALDAWLAKHGGKR